MSKGASFYLLMLLGLRSRGNCRCFSDRSRCDSSARGNLNHNTDCLPKRRPSAVCQPPEAGIVARRSGSREPDGYIHLLLRSNLLINCPGVATHQVTPQENNGITFRPRAGARIQKPPGLFKNLHRRKHSMIGDSHIHDKGRVIAEIFHR